MFCVKCGKEGETFDGLCIECFLNGKQLITMPHHVDLERCANCEEFRINGHWVATPLKEAVEDAALSSMAAIDGMRVVSAGVMTEEKDNRNFTVKADVDGKLKGHAVRSSAETIVRVKNNVCQRCSRQLGNYYEATIQIRAGSKELSDAHRDATVRYIRDRIENMAATNRGIFLTKVEEVQGGVDLYVSSTSLGRTLAKELSDAYGAETKESSKLIGKTEDGNDMYRMTYLVRMPEYHVNDVVIFEGEAYKLAGIGKGNGKLIKLSDLRESSIRRSQMSSLRVHTRFSEIIKATVVSRSENEIQILHPYNYSTVDVKIPKGAEIKDTADVAVIDGIVFFVP